MLARPTPRSALLLLVHAEEQLGVYGILRLAKVFNIRNTLSPGPQLGTEILILFCRGDYRSMVWRGQAGVLALYPAFYARDPVPSRIHGSLLFFRPEWCDDEDASSRSPQCLL